MTAKTDFTDEEWKQVLEAPPSAGLLVIASDKGGTIRESFSMAKAYGEARKEHGESELLDEILSTKPVVDKTKVESAEELKDHNLENLRQAVAAMEAKATPEELEGYRGFIVALAERVAETHKGVTDPEEAVIQEIKTAIGAS
jgi:hypothetical protein